VIEANYSDNPWFPAELEAERLHDKRTQPEEKYNHVWLGGYEKAGDRQFIPAGIVERAQMGEPYTHPQDEVIMGVDVARFGDDETVIAFRRGRDAAYQEWLALPKLDTMETAARVADLIDRQRPDAVFIDETGVGAGVVDRLRSLQYSVIGVNFGAGATGLTKVKTANKRAEMWQRMKEWLEQGGVRIPKDRMLEVELTGVEYKHDHNNAILLEKKEDMKKRGLKSPDRADALALTFAYPVSPRGAYEAEDNARGANDTTGY
jgi:phage terminase large subunit